MSRSDRRISRFLITTLLLFVSGGLLLFGYKMNRRAAPTLPAVAVAPAIAAPAVDQVAVVNPIALPPSGQDQPSQIDANATTEPSPQPTNDVWADVMPKSSGQHGVSQDETHAIPAANMTLGPTTSPSPDLMTLARRKIDAGDLLGAREQLNDTLQLGQLSPADAQAVKAMIGQINDTVLFSHQRFADDPYGGSYVVKPGESLARIASDNDTTWELLSRINGIDPKHLRAGATIKIVQGPFFAVVDKRQFTMEIYLGALPGEKSSMFVRSFGVGLGRDDSTPVGTWIVEPHRKLKHPTYYSPRGEGVIAADDPKNPLGGYWIGLTGTEGQAIGKLSYGIHGTIEPESIGKQSSMGCIRLRAEDIAVVYDLLVEGKSLVVVKE